MKYIITTIVFFCYSLCFSQNEHKEFEYGTIKRDKITILNSSTIYKRRLFLLKREKSLSLYIHKIDSISNFKLENIQITIKNNENKEISYKYISYGLPSYYDDFINFNVPDELEKCLCIHLEHKKKRNKVKVFIPLRYKCMIKDTRYSFGYILRKGSHTLIIEYLDKGEVITIDSVTLKVI